MISNILINKYNVQKVWSTLKKEESIVIGYIRAYLGECADGRWLVVILGRVRGVHKEYESHCNETY